MHITFTTKKSYHVPKNDRFAVEIFGSLLFLLQIPPKPPFSVQRDHNQETSQEFWGATGTSTDPRPAPALSRLPLRVGGPLPIPDPPPNPRRPSCWGSPDTRGPASEMRDEHTCPFR